jgi:hypothetical protein
MVSRLTRIRPGKVAATAVAVFAFWTAPAAADTTVSLTFDDGNANQMLALPILDDHDMDGTFYIIPGRVGNANYVTWSQVDQIYDDGNEIGGHTMNHAHLTQISEDAARDEICDGRQALLDRGYPDISFAYPFGEHDDTTEGLVEECGYLSGRGVAGLQRDPGEPDAESIPPRDRWVIRTRGSVDVEDTLPEIKDWIMDAEAVDDGNGSADAWIPLVFHHLCDPNVTDCEGGPAEDQYITPSDFDALLDWLQARESAGTNVRTIGDVMAPPSPPPPGGGAPGGSGATLGAFTSFKSLPNGTAKLTLEVTGPGVLEAADGRVAKTAVAAGTNGAARIRPTSKYVPQAGEVTLKIIPSKAGKKLLKKKGKLTARIRVRFTPASGSPAEQTVKVRLKLKGR